MVTEDTQAKSEEDALIEQMIKEAEKTQELGEVVPGMVFHRGDAEIPPPIVVSSIQDGSKVRVYDTKTGVMSWVLYNPETGGALRKLLRKKRDDGSPVFTLNKPPFEPAKGTFKCLLHRDDPNRTHYDLLGFAVCPKDSLASPYQVRRHMQKRHKDEWGAIEQERIDAERKEDRDFQRMLIARATPTERLEDKVFVCEVEGCGKSFTTRIALEGHKRSHK